MSIMQAVLAISAGFRRLTRPQQYISRTAYILLKKELLVRKGIWTKQKKYIDGLFARSATVETLQQQMSAHYHRAFAEMRKTIDREVAANTAQLSSQVAAYRSTCADLRRRANQDPLTGLPNERALSEQFAIVYSAIIRAITVSAEDQTEPRAPVPVSVSALMIEIDDFRSINDHYGGAIGDQIMVQVVKVIREHFGAKRPSDLFCRWGKGQLFVVLPHCGADRAYTMALPAVHAVSQTSMLEGKVVTISVGVAESKVQAAQIRSAADRLLDNLVVHSTQALYRAMTADPPDQGDHPGRNRVMR